MMAYSMIENCNIFSIFILYVVTNYLYLYQWRKWLPNN